MGTCYINDHIYNIMPVKLNSNRKKRNVLNPHAIFKSLSQNVFTDFIKFDSGKTSYSYLKKNVIFIFKSLEH